MASPSTAEVSPKPRSRFWLWLTVLLAVNLLARLPLCWDPATVDNDGAEYLAIARHLRAGQGYVTDLKWQFYTPDPVVHPAWADRPPLYPFLALASQRAMPGLDPTAAARLGNVLLTCVALWLCALYLRRTYGDQIALYAAGFVFLLPHTLKWTTQPMTETVTLLLTFAALLLWTDRDRGGWGRQAGVALVVGMLSGLAYLARPTGAVLVAVFLLDLLLAHGAVEPDDRGERPQDPGRVHPALSLLAGLAACVLPYPLLLWKLYGSPLHSALGFTFAVQTYYEVSYYGFEQPRPTTAAFLRTHWPAVPGLILHQLWRHVQILVPQLIPFLPAGLLMRKQDWRGDRWAGGALVVGLFLVHTVTWAAWGSSRYFLAALPILVAALLAATERVEGAAGWSRVYARHLRVVAAVGLAVCVAAFYHTQARPDRGLPSLPAWRKGAEAARGLGTVASDKPAILNLLLEAPAVRLPRTTDVALLERFLRAYEPAVLVLFDDEPAEAPMASAWRSGRLPTGWLLAVDEPGLLVARKEEAIRNREAPDRQIAN